MELPLVKFQTDHILKFSHFGELFVFLMGVRAGGGDSVEGVKLLLRKFLFKYGGLDPIWCHLRTDSMVRNYHYLVIFWL